MRDGTILLQQIWCWAPNVEVPRLPGWPYLAQDKTQERCTCSLKCLLLSWTLSGQYWEVCVALHCTELNFFRSFLWALCCIPSWTLWGYYWEACNACNALHCFELNTLRPLWAWPPVCAQAKPEHLHLAWELPSLGILTKRTIAFTGKCCSSQVANLAPWLLNTYLT